MPIKMSSEAVRKDKSSCGVTENIILKRVKCKIGILQRWVTMMKISGFILIYFEGDII